MDAGVVSIIVALIGGLSLILASLASFRRENRSDHQVVSHRLNQIDKAVNKVSDKMDTHITDHAKGVM